MSNFLILTFICIFAIGNHPSDGGQVAEFQPEFAEPLNNLSVPLGRDATFTCMVQSLGGYRVGWVRADTKAIQAIHNHVITHNPRVSVTHSDHSMWHLHIKGVKSEDNGPYMCQINTDPMMSQIAYLEIVIPPDFIPEETSSDQMAPEGSTVKLQCNARGHPKPSIIWRREGGQNITLNKNNGAKTQVSVHEGNVLKLQKVSRADMGPYLCMKHSLFCFDRYFKQRYTTVYKQADPSFCALLVLARLKEGNNNIMHQVDCNSIPTSSRLESFNPVIHVPNQLVAGRINSEINLECNVEAYPRSIHFWMKENGGAMIISADRYEVQEIVKSMFEVKMILTIRKFRRADAGAYHCIAKNSLGDVDSVVKLHVLKIPPDSTDSPNGENELVPFSYDEDDYYDTLDSKSTDELERRGSGERKSHQNSGHPQSGISNNYTPGGSPNNRNSNNNNINNGRHSRKSYSSSGSNNNLGTNKNRDRDTNNPNSNGNIPFQQKTVVVSLSPNGLPNSSATYPHYHNYVFVVAVILKILVM